MSDFVDIVYESWVQKKGSKKIHPWKKRWLVLFDDQRAKYYDDASKKDCKGVIDLTEIEGISHSEQTSKDFPFGFKIHTLHRVFLFCCKDIDVRSKWIENIRRVAKVTNTLKKLATQSKLEAIEKDFYFSQEENSVDDSESDPNNFPLKQENSEAELSKLQRTIRILEEANEKLEQSNYDLKHERDEYKSEVESLVSLMKNKDESFQYKNTELKSQFVELHQANAEKDQEIQVMRDKLNFLNGKIRESQRVSVKIRDEDNDQFMELLKYKKDNERLRNENKELKIQILNIETNKNINISTNRITFDHEPPKHTSIFDCFKKRSRKNEEQSYTLMSA